MNHPASLDTLLPSWHTILAVPKHLPLPLFHCLLLYLIVGVALLVFKAVPAHAQSLPPSQVSHYSGYKQQLPNGTVTCEGFSTNLTTQDYQAVIKYKGDPACCGVQTDGDGIWIGGNNATQIGVDFIRNLNRLQFKNLGPTQITTTLDGQWHTYSVTKTGTTATMILDGQTIRTDTAAPSAPSIMALGGECTAPHLFNWNNFWYDATFYNQNVCTANTTTALVATSSNPNDFRKAYGNILLGQTTAYIKGYNSIGVLRSLRESLNGWLVNSPLNNNPYSVYIFGWQIGLHTITAAGGGENYCATTGTATFNCINQPPFITPQSPVGLVTSLPTTFSWMASDTNYKDFGMDSCGGNANPNDDSLTFNLFNGSGCTGSPLGKACNDITGIDSSKHDNSCQSIYSFPNSPHTYSWQIIAKNGPTVQNKSTVCTDFTYQPSANPWWQTDSGHVYGASGIKSLIPCTGSACKFSLASLGSPGIVTYNTGGADFNGGENLSQTGWLAAGSEYLAQGPSFDELYRQLPVASTSIPAILDQPTFNTLTSASPATDAYYLEYPGGGSFTISGLNVGDKKVVVYSKSAAQVDLTGNISVNHGKGFFALITAVPVKIAATVSNLDTLIFTESSISTGTIGGDDQPLMVRGMAIAKGTVNLERDLDRSKTTGKNSLGPAEKFIFAPDYLFVMPRGLRRFRYQLNEVAP